MAEGKRFICSNCEHSIEAWDEGNPYYVDPNGMKKYAYHPNPDRERCIGNDSPHLCLECGTEFNVDSRKPVTITPCCGSVKFVDCYSLKNHSCPKFKKGKFRVDPGYSVIS